MAEVSVKRQESRAGDVTQAQTTFKNADFREERFSKVAGVVSAVGKGVAEGLQTQVDDAFFSTEESEAGVNDFIGEVGGNIAIDKVAAGSETRTLSPENISEIADTELRKHTLTKQRLDAAVKRGLISTNTAQNLATLGLKRATNNPTGSLITQALRDIYSPLTGSPSSSPAVTFTKTAQEQQADAEQKLRVEAGAVRTISLEKIQKTMSMSPPESEEYLSRLEANSAKIAEGEARAQQRKLNNTEIMAGVDAQIIEANEVWGSETTDALRNGTLLPAQVNTVKADLRKKYDEILAKASNKGLSDTTALRQRLTENFATRTATLDLYDKRQISAQELELANTMTEGLAIATFPEAVLLVKVDPVIAQSLAGKGLDREAYRQEILNYAGKERGEKILAELDLMANTFKSFRLLTEQKPMTTDMVGAVIAGALQFTPEVRSDVFNMVDEDPQKAKWHADTFRTTSGASIGSLSSTLEEDMPSLKGVKQTASAKAYTIAVNAKTTAISREILDDPKLDGHVFTMAPIGNQVNDRSWGVNFPEGYENEDFKAAVKDYSRFMRNTPTYWSGYANTWQEAVEIGLNDGKQVTPQELIAGVKAKSDRDAEKIGLAPGTGIGAAVSEAAGAVGEALVAVSPVTMVKNVLDTATGALSAIGTASQEAQHTESSKVRNSEGITLTDGRTPTEQLQVISQGIASGELEADAKTMEAITILGNQINEDNANSVNNAGSGTATDGKAQESSGALDSATGDTGANEVKIRNANIPSDGTPPETGKYSSIPTSDDNFKTDEFVMWREWYNADEDMTKDNITDAAHRGQGIVNNPTPTQEENLNKVSEVVRSIGVDVFSAEMTAAGLTVNDLDSIMALTAAIETNAGTSTDILGNPKTVSDTGAAGLMQVTPFTARSLITDEKVFGPKAQAALGERFIDEFMVATDDEQRAILVANPTANILFAMGKYLSTKRIRKDLAQAVK